MKAGRFWFAGAVLARIALAAVWLSVPSVLIAQQGALFLLAPFGARSVGQGEAVVADTALGTEGIWWNAASMARMTKRAISLHSSKTVFANSNMLAYAYPSKVLGTVAIAAQLVDYGTTDFTIDDETPLALSYNRNYMIAASYATPIGKQLNVGLTYKFIGISFLCPGCPPNSSLKGSTSALDFGAQYTVSTRIPFTLGAVVRNVGQKFQVKDGDQADPLPLVTQFGARARVPIAALKRSDASLDVMADYLISEVLHSQSMRFGSALAYKETLILRGGITQESGVGTAYSIGVGVQRGKFSLDIARRFQAVTLGEADSPTHVSVHWSF